MSLFELQKKLRCEVYDFSDSSVLGLVERLFFIAL